MSHAQALETILSSRHWWRPEILAAFLATVGAGPGVTEGSGAREVAASGGR
jgi:hypothetical protein